METMLSPLKNITIKGYKSIRELDLSLASLNILIGANGSGKSNFISVFAFLKQMAEGRLQEYVATRGGADTILYFGRKVTELLSFRVEITGYTYTVDLLPTIQDRLVIKQENCTAEITDLIRDGEESYEISALQSAENGVTESLLHSRHDTDGLGCTLGGLFLQWHIFHFNDTSDTAKVRGASNIDDNDYLRPDGSNLAAMLYLLQKKHREHYRNIVDVIRLAAPFFDEFHLRPDPLRERLIRLAWRQRGSDQYFDAHALSDGTLRFICLATLLMQPNLPPLILLDEPELGLHPYAVALVAGLLQSAAKRTQVVVSTQSVTLVNRCAPDDIVVVDHDQAQSTFRRLTADEIAGWLDEYTLGELWEMNVLGGRP